jgi:serine/threonine-protein kinase PknG
VEGDVRVSDGSPCGFAGCDGTIVAGYCEVCGRAPARVAAAAAPAQAPAPASPPPLPTVDGMPSMPSLPQPDPTGGGSSQESGQDNGGAGNGHGLGGRRPVTAPTYRVGAAQAGEGDPCPFDDCDGSIEGGYCGTCGRAPVVQPEVASRSNRMPTLRPLAGDAPPPAHLPPRLDPARPGDTSTGSHRTTTGSGRTSGRTTSGRTSGRTSSGRSGTRLGLGLVEVPAVRTGDPAEALMAVAEVPEDKRYCSGCNQPVGRSRNHRPGRTEGFCPNCRNRFSFLPKLQAGDLVAGQYEVLGVLAHGGLGWIYLARDRAVSDRWVVLKGLIDSSSQDAAIAAVAERQFLAALDHPNVVRIYNFVTHEDAGYIVMEYVGGKTLKAILKERRDANGGRMNPLPVEVAMAYTLAVLPALGYFHTQGLVYCDMKPDNIILTGDSLKIIDLGGVRRIDDEESAIYGTTGYQAPEVAEVGPTPVSDLYTVGRMLAVLVLDFRGYQSAYADSLPTPDEQPLLGQHESLHRFLLKSTAHDPTDRFDAADEMAEQLMGILREAAAAHGHPQPAVSRVFGPDGVVGVGADDYVPPDWRLLPQPKVDPGDPGAGFLLGLADGEPGAVVSTLTTALADGAVPDSPETLLRLARAHLESGDAQSAGATLNRLGDGRDWRLWWQRGLRALADGAPAAAIDWLDPVYTDLPGEVPAKLALALAYELAGDLMRSAELYDVASRTDPAYVSGAFGLARVRLAAGDREGAVGALSRVPAASSVHVAARIAAVRALASPPGVAGSSLPPTAEQMERASGILDQLYLDPRRRALLACELYEAGLAALSAGTPMSAGRVLGRPLEEGPLRQGLESTYRQLARLATTTRERNELVDQANRVRPRTLL